MAGTLEVPVEGNANTTEDPKVKAGIKRLNELLEGSNLIAEAGLGTASVGSAKLATSAKELFPQLPSSAARTVINGQVSSAGAVVLGTGFTSEKTATGKYTIKLTTELATTAVVQGTFAAEGVFGFFNVATATKKEIKVESRNAAQTLADQAFNFYVFG